MLGELITAVVTPFQADGAVDLERARRLGADDEPIGWHAGEPGDLLARARTHVDRAISRRVLSARQT